MMAYILLLAIAVFIGLLYCKKRDKREKPQPETGKPPEGIPVNTPAISNGGGIEVTTGYVLQDGKKKEVTIQYMPQGLQVFDERRNIILDLTNRLVKYIGSGFIDVAMDEGEILNDEITEAGDLWYVLIEGTSSSPKFYPEDFGEEFPRLTKERGRIKWKYTKAGRRGGTIIYGVW